MQTILEQHMKDVEEMDQRIRDLVQDPVKYKAGVVCLYRDLGTLFAKNMQLGEPADGLWLNVWDILLEGRAKKDSGPVLKPMYLAVLAATRQKEKAQNVPIPQGGPAVETIVKKGEKIITSMPKTKVSEIANKHESAPASIQHQTSAPASTQHQTLVPASTQHQTPTPSLTKNEPHASDINLQKTQKQRIDSHQIEKEKLPNAEEVLVPEKKRRKKRSTPVYSTDDEGGEVKSEQPIERTKKKARRPKDGPRIISEGADNVDAVTPAASITKKPKKKKTASAGTKATPGDDATTAMDTVDLSEWVKRDIPCLTCNKINADCMIIADPEKREGTACLRCKSGKKWCPLTNLDHSAVQFKSSFTDAMVTESGENMNFGDWVVRMMIESRNMQTRLMNTEAALAVLQKQLELNAEAVQGLKEEMTNTIHSATDNIIENFKKYGQTIATDPSRTFGEYEGPRLVPNFSTGSPTCTTNNSYSSVETKEPQVPVTAPYVMGEIYRQPTATSTVAQVRPDAHSASEPANSNRIEPFLDVVTNQASDTAGNLPSATYTSHASHGSREANTSFSLFDADSHSNIGGNQWGQRPEPYTEGAPASGDSTHEHCIFKTYLNVPNDFSHGQQVDVDTGNAVISTKANDSTYPDPAKSPPTQITTSLATSTTNKEIDRIKDSTEATEMSRVGSNATENVHKAPEPSHIDMIKDSSGSPKISKAGSETTEVVQMVPEPDINTLSTSSDSKQDMASKKTALVAYPLSPESENKDLDPEATVSTTKKRKGQSLEAEGGQTKKAKI